MKIAFNVEIRVFIFRKEKVFKNNNKTNVLKRKKNIMFVNYFVKMFYFLEEISSILIHILLYYALDALIYNSIKLLKYSH